MGIINFILGRLEALYALLHPVFDHLPTNGWFGLALGLLALTLIRDQRKGSRPRK